MNNQRNRSLDILCGLLIIHMISGHIFLKAKVGDSSFFHIEQLLLFFFMPWFFFKNGMFFRHNTNYGAFVHRSFKRLMIPFLTWGIIATPFWLFYVATGEHSGFLGWYLASLKSLPMYGMFEGNSPLWFLLSLFVVRVVYNQAYSSKTVTWILVVVSVAVPFAFYCIGFVSLHSISHTLLGFFFFHWGYRLREKQYHGKVFATATILCLAVVVSSPIYVEMFSNYLTFDDCYLVYFPYALAAIVVFNNVFRYFYHPPVVLLKTIHIQWFVNAIESIGRDSMNYLVTHWILLLVVETIMVNILGLDYGWVMFWVMTTTCIVVLPLLSRLLNRPCFDAVMGRKK